MLRVGIVGFGSRGQMFAQLIANKNGDIKLVAVAEPVEASREKALSMGVDKKMIFNNADEFFAQGKICDAVFICTQDKEHCKQAVKAMEVGYDICLEKPAATTIEDCILIRETANRLKKKVMLTHVLRYAPFYGYIKKTVMEGIIGEVVDFEQTENVAYWHFGLSYVRGPWGNMEESSPTIIAKCCHDLDIIRWIIDKKCKSISSFGKLFYFNKEHAPKGSADYCVDCNPKVRENCIYNAYKIYPDNIAKGVVGGTARLKNQDVNRVIDGKQDKISKCIYHSDNDAIDNQIVNMQFENGTTAHLTMTAFSEDCHRLTHVYGTKGEIYGDVDESMLHINVFGKDRKTIDLNKINLSGYSLDGGHGGGDAFLLDDFVDYITHNNESYTRTTIDESIESHIMGFKAEESRIKGGKVIEL